MIIVDQKRVAELMENLRISFFEAYMRVKKSMGVQNVSLPPVAGVNSRSPGESVIARAIAHQSENSPLLIAAKNPQRRFSTL